MFIRIHSSINAIQAAPQPIFGAENMKDRISDHLGVEVALRFGLSAHHHRQVETLASGPASNPLHFHPASP
jgi:hypothetical protein